MGRHKKNCQCERCVAKRKEEELKGQMTIGEEIGEEKIDKIVDNLQPTENVADEQILLEDASHNNGVAGEVTTGIQGSESKEEKIQKFVFMYADIIEFVCNTVFTRMGWETLSKIEKDLLVESCAKVAIKYSDIEFKYAEEFNLVIILSVIILPRVKKGKAKEETKGGITEG